MNFLDAKVLKLLRKKVLSIDIGSYSTKFVVGRSLAGEVSIEKMISAKTPEDIYQDGQILNINSMKDFIDKTIREEKIKSSHLSFTINSSSLIMKEISIPFANPKDLKPMIEFEIEQYLPIDINQYNVQYKLLGSFMEDGVKKAIFVVAALPKVISDSYLQLSNMLGLKPYALDIHSNCISKLLNNKTKINKEHDISSETIALLDLGHIFTEAVVIENGEFKFGRLINSGGKDIDIHLANAYNLTILDASEKKFKIKDLTRDSIESPLESMIKETVILGMNNLMQEVERIFKFYTTRTTGNRIDKILIYGGGTRLSGIDKLIEKFFNIPTFKVNCISEINIDLKKFNKGYDFDSDDIDISVYMNAIGAIIRS